MKEEKNKQEMICGICHLQILYIEDYVILTDYIKGKEHGKLYYHRECFKDKVGGGKDLKVLQNKANKFLEFAMQKVGME